MCVLLTVYISKQTACWKSSVRFSTVLRFWWFYTRLNQITTPNSLYRKRSKLNVVCRLTASTTFSFSWNSKKTWLPWPSFKSLSLISGIVIANLVSLYSSSSHFIAILLTLAMSSAVLNSSQTRIPGQTLLLSLNIDNTNTIIIRYLLLLPFPLFHSEIWKFIHSFNFHQTNLFKLISLECLTCFALHCFALVMRHDDNRLVIVLSVTELKSFRFECYIYSLWKWAWVLVWADFVRWVGDFISLLFHELDGMSWAQLDTFPVREEKVFLCRLGLVKTSKRVKGTYMHLVFGFG